jgi:hypothetical protein
MPTNVGLAANAALIQAAGLPPKRPKRLWGGGELTVEAILAATQDNLMIDISEDEYSPDGGPIATMWYKHMNDMTGKPNQQIYENYPQGRCINLGENGCVLPLEDKPRSCAEMNPAHCDVEGFPVSGSKEDIAREREHFKEFFVEFNRGWREHRGVLGQAVLEISGRTTEDLYYERLMRRMFGWGF